MFNSHEIVPIEIDGNKVEVDRRISRIVLWMNSLPGIRTIWSCEGGDLQKPYVVFSCSEPSSLRIVLERLWVHLASYDLMQLGTVEIELELSPEGKWKDGFRYCLRLKNDEMRDIMTGRLKRHW